MYYIQKPRKINVGTVDTYTDKEESRYNHMRKLEISNKTAILITLSFFLVACAKAFCLEPTPNVTYWDGAGNQWTCSNCGTTNYCWQTSCSNCGNSQ